MESKTGIFTSFSAGILTLQYEYTNLDTSKIATHLPNLFEAISSFGGMLTEVITMLVVPVLCSWIQERKLS